MNRFVFAVPMTNFTESFKRMHYEKEYGKASMKDMKRATRKRMPRTRDGIGSNLKFKVFIGKCLSDAE